MPLLMKLKSFRRKLPRVIKVPGFGPGMCKTIQLLHLFSEGGNYRACSSTQSAYVLTGRYVYRCNPYRLCRIPL